MAAPMASICRPAIDHTVDGLRGPPLINHFEGRILKILLLRLSRHHHDQCQRQKGATNCLILHRLFLIHQGIHVGWLHADINGHILESLDLLVCDILVGLDNQGKH